MNKKFFLSKSLPEIPIKPIRLQFTSFVSNIEDLFFDDFIVKQAKKKNKSEISRLGKIAINGWWEMCAFKHL